MGKTVVIHQPDFLSYLGFFHRFLHADLYVALDTVQFVTNTSRSWHNRDKIKTPAGERWLTVAVDKAHAYAVLSDIRLSSRVDWRKDNLNLLRENYRKAPFFVEIFPRLEELYGFPAERMVEFNLRSIALLCELFDIRIETKLASDLGTVGTSNELLVDILSKVSATRYLSGSGARAYYDPVPFEKAGIEVVWQEFKHPDYEQLHGAFIPHLSSIDLLLNCGIERSREILRNS